MSPSANRLPVSTASSAPVNRYTPMPTPSRPDTTAITAAVTYQ
ncbi:hypothetical protein [Streptomyces venezuelae]|nr:hypothetical protein [Streptomyces venezuelae]